MQEEMRERKRKAYAKINLALDVVGRKENGYHLVKMIMQTVDLCDELSFLDVTGEEDAPVIQVVTDKAELGDMKDNLIYKAAGLLRDTYEVNQKVRIHLKKQIPIAAGMAGGSTDAAATLLGLNELWNLGLGKEELCRLGVKIGADVPYCIMGGTALAEGIGEELTPLPAPPKAVLLIAKPEFGVSTQYVYQHIDKEGIEVHPDVDGMIQALEQGDLQGICSRLGNVLEQVTKKEHPQIGMIKALMNRFGAKGSLMSGSGPTVFGIFEQNAMAEEAFCAISEAGLAREIYISGFHNEASPSETR